MVGVLVALAVSTLWLTGVIWTVQVLHYPLFALVGADAYAGYQAAHVTRITWLLLGPWAVQGAATGWTLLSRPAGVPWWMVLTAAALAATAVLVTLVVSVPQHEVLGGGFDGVAHSTLVRTNWWRTLAWSTHAVLAVWMLVRHLRAT